MEFSYKTTRVQYTWQKFTSRPLLFSISLFLLIVMIIEAFAPLYAQEFVYGHLWPCLIVFMLTILSYVVIGFFSILPGGYFFANEIKGQIDLDKGEIKLSATWENGSFYREITRKIKKVKRRKKHLEIYVEPAFITQLIPLGCLSKEDIALLEKRFADQ